MNPAHGMIGRMRHVLRSGCFLVVALACATARVAAGPITVDFEDVLLPPSGYLNGEPNPNTLTGTTGSIDNTFLSGGVSFANTYSNWYDDVNEINTPYWSGFAFSNVQDGTTAGFTNQYAAYPGGGYGASPNYAVAYGDGTTLSLPAPGTVSGFEIANTTYAALSMRDGDPYGFSSRLAPGGFFLVTATGKLQGAVTGATSFYLADLRTESSPGILDGWAWYDLSSLGIVDAVSFRFDGSDKSAIYGLKTPAYFAMDNLTYVPVPEPPAAWLVAAAGGGWWLLQLRRRAGRVSSLSQARRVSP